MSLARVKQVVYLQNDFTAYKIGNIMYNLANRIPTKDLLGNAVSTLPGAPVPIPASVDLDGIKTFVDYEPSITSFLCTDTARGIFERGSSTSRSISQ
jgi:hypothetical protein